MKRHIYVQSVTTGNSHSWTYK